MSQIAFEWAGPGKDITPMKEIRLKVFCEEQGYSPEMEFDEKDPIAWHLLLLYNGQPAGTGRILDAGEGCFKLGRIAVQKELRKHHLGAALMQELMRKARELGAKEFVISAQVRARGFYEKCGFTVCGTGIYPDGHVPHIDMRRNAEPL